MLPQFIPGNLSKLNEPCSENGKEKRERTKSTLSQLWSFEIHSYDVPELNKIHRYPDFEAIRLLKNRSGGKEYLEHALVGLLIGKISSSRILKMSAYKTDMFNIFMSLLGQLFSPTEALFAKLYCA